MPRASYQYGTSPRKYEPDYKTKPATRKVAKKETAKKSSKKETVQKSEAKKRIEKQRKEKVVQTKNRTLQVIAVLAIFGMLLALSYREITIMEMFNQKKNLETQLATIQKENGQVEKNIREVESTLNWNDIHKTATESLGMQIKTAIPVDLEKTDNVETKNKFIKEEETNLIEEVIEYFIKK